MKKITFIVMALFLSAICKVSAQSLAEQNLNDAIQSAENVQQEVVIARKVVNQLVKQLTVIGNPNAALFATQMQNHTNNVLNNSDDIHYFIGLAHSNSAIPFDSTVVTNAANELVNQNDIIMIVTNQITVAINSGNTSLALSYIQPLRAALTKQLNKATTIITKIESIKVAIKTYNVCIKTVNGQGNPTSYNAGFYAYSEATGYIYPDNQEGTCYTNLIPGTYTFSSFQDYFCGTSSVTVTLSPEMVNEDGIIEITLVVWCE